MEKSTKRDRSETLPEPGSETAPEELRDSVLMREKFAVYDQGYRDGYADSRYHLLLYATGFILGAMIARSIYKSIEP